MRQKLGEWLVQAGVIAEADLEQALAEHRRSGEQLGVVLARLKFATEEQIAKTIASQLGLPYLDLTSHSAEPDALLLIPESIARAHMCFPISVAENVLTIAIADPLAFSVIEDLESRTGHRIKTVVATHREILNALENGHASAPIVRPGNGPAAVAAPQIGPETPRVEDLFARIIHAVENDASDVHVEPSDHALGVRYRIDGVLQPATTLPRALYDPLVRHIKSLAGMDVQERRLPQNGRIGSSRVSTLPTIFGEKVVIQRLAGRKVAPPLDALGLSAVALDGLRGLLRQRSGVIIFAGPSGSGTTTTLAGAVSAVATGGISTVAVNDPIEYEIPGVTHVAIDEAATLTTASAVRASLEQRADVIAIGELTVETAPVACDAAAAGCLVLSTLRADDAAAAVRRLLDAGTTFGVAGSLLGVVAQRLVRRLCAHCRQRFAPPADLLRRLGVAEPDTVGEIYKAAGCDECHYTGYRGRIGIFEVMRVTEAVRRLIASAATEVQIREQATADGMATLAEDGLSKVRQGMTTVDELLRAVGELIEPRTLCGRCGAAVNADFKACPRCGNRLGTCRHCGRALEPGWQFCPYCAGGTTVP